MSHFPPLSEGLDLLMQSLQGCQILTLFSSTSPAVCHTSAGETLALESSMDFPDGRAEHTQKVCTPGAFTLLGQVAGAVLFGSMAVLAMQTNSTRVDKQLVEFQECRLSIVLHCDAPS